MMDRVADAVQLRVSTFQEADRDAALEKEARNIVLAISVVTGLGTLVGAALRGSIGGGLYNAVLSAVMTFLAWHLLSYLLWVIGTRSLDGRGSLDGMRRSLAYAMPPLALLPLGFLPVVGPSLLTGGMLWAVAAALVAVRQSLHFTFTQATVTVIFAWLSSVVIVGLAYAILLIPLTFVQALIAR